MSHMIGISKAARILGINRLKLRKRLDNVGIPTFDGMVDLEELQKVAPQLAHESQIVEKTRYIRKNAAAFRYGSGAKPTADELSAEVRKVTMELLLVRRKADQYQRIFDRLSGKLEGFLDSDDLRQKELALALNKWLIEELRH